MDYEHFAKKYNGNQIINRLKSKEAWSGVNQWSFTRPYSVIEEWIKIFNKDMLFHPKSQPLMEEVFIVVSDTLNDKGE